MWLSWKTGVMPNGSQIVMPVLSTGELVDGVMDVTLEQHLDSITTMTIRVATATIGGDAPEEEDKRIGYASPTVHGEG